MDGHQKSDSITSALPVGGGSHKGSQFQTVGAVLDSASSWEVAQFWKSMEMMKHISVAIFWKHNLP